MRDTILAHIQQILQSEGASPRGVDVMHRLFQEALESATGVGSAEGLGGYVPLDGESHEAMDRNIGPLLTASAIAFAGTEIADAIRTGLSEIAEAIESRNDD